MEWLNYHHLRYFWAVAREGGVTRAARRLNTSQPTVSGQVRELESTLGERLFSRSGRGLVLTEMGSLVFRYADEIFSLGQELLSTVKGRPTARPLLLRVGIADVLPKLVASRLLLRALRSKQPVRLQCVEDQPERLLPELSTHRLDLVLSDAPADPTIRVRVFSRVLGASGVTMFAVPALASSCRKGFPRSLDGAPVLLPTRVCLLRRSLDDWFSSLGIQPHLVAEVEDSALLKSLGQAGVGVFPAPSSVEGEVVRQHGVRVVGRTDAVKTEVYGLLAERKIRHPAVEAICGAP